MTIRPIRFLLFCLSLILIISSCKRINEATDLGDEIIPGADGVNTFDTTLAGLETYSHIFTNDNDSVRVGRVNAQIIGNIENDPLFGQTNAKLFIDFRPEVYPYNFSGVYDDSLYIDSVVLVLGWSGSYGDTMAAQRVNVSEIDPSSDFRIDSFYTIRDPGFLTTALLGTKTFVPANLKDSVRAFRDTTAGQLRIRLNNSFGQRLLDYDTTNAYRSDSAFNTYFNGFEIAADNAMGNAVMAFGVNNNANSKLAIYYRFTKDGKTDTTVDYFRFTNTCAIHNYVKRDFSSALLNASNSPGEDDELYIINTPGSYAKIKIPALRNLSNRIVNRAELIVEQLYDPSNDKFPYPDAMMLDVYDSTLADYKFVPYDFLPEIQSGIPNANFGLYGKTTVDNVGRPIRVWKFNITRYVQNVVTKQESLHDFRLYTTQNAIGNIREGTLTNTGSYRFVSVFVNPFYVFGRAKIGGGKHPTQNLRLRIVHTKI